MLRLLAGLTSAFLLAGTAQAQTLHTVADGLEYPWSVAFLPDGRMLVTEKPGRLRIVDEDGLVPETVAGVPNVFYSGQGGLLDVALSPDFAEDGRVYLTWTAGPERNNTLHLGAGRLTGQALEDFEILFTASPSRRTNVHYGGRIAFLPDEAETPATLILGIGDGFDYREQAQNPGSHFGSFVRLSLDGEPLASSFPDAAPGVYSIGHRNPQAVVYDAASGILYANEHGPRGGDEINILVEGRNYGWPIVSQGIDYTGALVTPFDAYEGMQDPLVNWTPSIAPAGMAIYRGDVFPDWEGDLLVAALITGDAGTPSGHVRRVELEDGEVVSQTILFGGLEARIRDVRVAPDGTVWLLTDDENGQLIQVTP